MKVIFVFLLAFSVKGYSQRPAVFIGQWEVVSIKGSDFYHNYEKDSTVLFEKTKQEMKWGGRDSIIAMQVIHFKKMFIKIMTFSFYEDGRYEQNAFMLGEEIKDAGTFEVDEAKKIIYGYRTTPAGLKVKDVIPFSWEGKHLFISLPLDNDDEPATTIELKKK